MKKIGLVVGVFTILVLLSGVALSGQNQTAVSALFDKSVSTAPEVGNKVSSCMANGSAASNINIAQGASCIEKNLQCTLNGTPCCSPYDCKGKFPNTYCQ